MVPKYIFKYVKINGRFGSYLKKKPDVLILVGDRYETFIAAVAAVILKSK